MRTKPIATLLLVLALAGSACAGGDDSASSVTVPATEPTTTSTTAASTTTTTEDPKAAVEQAFYDQWDAFVEILGDPDPRNPLIDKYFTGEAREQLCSTACPRLCSIGTAFRCCPTIRTIFKPRIVKIDHLCEPTAVVFECTIEGLVFYRPGLGRGRR